jgi:hypothetical protein
MLLRRSVAMAPLQLAITVLLPLVTEPCSCCWLRAPPVTGYSPSTTLRMAPRLQHGVHHHRLPRNRRTNLVPSRVNHLPMWPVRLGNPQNQPSTPSTLGFNLHRQISVGFPASTNGEPEFYSEPALQPVTNSDVTKLCGGQNKAFDGNTSAARTVPWRIATRNSSIWLHFLL